MNTNSMIFRIQRNDKTQDIGPDQTPSKEVEENIQKLKLQEEDGATSLKPEDAPATDSGVKEIILRSPIGHAITEVLQLLFNRKDNKTGVLRTESNMAQMVVATINEEAEQDPAVSEKHKAYIFVQDGRRMNLGEIDALGALATKAKNAGAEYVGVLMDNIDSATPQGKFMAEAALHLESQGVKVLYRRDTVLRKMRSLIGDF